MSKQDSTIFAFLFDSEIWKDYFAPSSDTTAVLSGFFSQTERNPVLLFAVLLLLSTITWLAMQWILLRRTSAQLASSSSAGGKAGNALRGFRPIPTSIIDGCQYPYGVVQVQGRRDYMEDQHLAFAHVSVSTTDEPKSKSAISSSAEKAGKTSTDEGGVVSEGGVDINKLSLYGVFDGHGGAAAANFCKEFFVSHIVASPTAPADDAGAALTHAFKAIDDDFLDFANSRTDDSGTTSIVMLADSTHLTVANAGDSRGVVVTSDGSVRALSKDHKPGHADERARITGLGGAVVHWGVWRVEGVLAVSRGIGDRLLKRYVIPDPDIVRMEIEEEDCFAVLATDGLWDVMRNNEVGFFLNACDDAQEAANVLVNEAFERRTMDNVTVMVVDLRKGISKMAGQTTEQTDDEIAKPNDDERSVSGSDVDTGDDADVDESDTEMVGKQAAVEATVGDTGDVIKEK